jgi:RNA polymerase sigma-70 factor (ECF subfamily)
MLADDETAFNTFVEEYFPRLYRYAHHRLANDQDVEDVVQQVLIKAIRRIETFRGESTLLTWLISICRNEISQHFEKTSQTRDLVQPFLNDDVFRAIVESLESPPDDEPEAITMRQDMISVIQLALDQLPEKHARALELKYIQGFSSKEIAKKLGIGDAATQSLLARSRRAFREVCSEAMYLFLNSDNPSRNTREK